MPLLEKVLRAPLDKVIISLINYRATDGEDGVRHLSDIFTFDQVDSLEEINVGYSVFYAGFLEPEKEVEIRTLINTIKYINHVYYIN